MNVHLNMSPVDWIISGLALIAYCPLILGLFKEKNDKSHNWFLWFVYFLIDFISFLATTKTEHAGSSAILLGFSAGSLFMSGILLYQKRGSWNKEERITSLLVFFCITTWLVCGPYWALISGILAEAIIGVYHIKKTFDCPVSKHNLPAYKLFFISSITSLSDSIFQGQWNIEQLGFPLLEAILSSIIIFPLLKKRTI